jgi:predicted Zn-dependent peptidase
VATPKPGGSIEKLENALQCEIDALQSEPISTADRKRIRNQLEARKLRELQSVSSRADYLNMFNIYFDNPDLINTELEEYRRITREQMQETARTYLTRSNRTVLTFLPETEERS